jgi:hypothetical protein
VKPSVNWLLALIPVTLALEHGGAPAPWLLNATFGNAPELIIALVALRAGLLDMVRASIVGAILANLPLALGVAFLVGGLRFQPAGDRIALPGRPDRGPRGGQRARQLVQGSAARDRVPDHRAHVLPPSDGVVIVPSC